ncbi:MAG: type III pantothenate kinase [Desulfomonilia bacterium]|nr:type III pantothenate kinase [Desulfomonilia bacterium]
MIVIDAGNTLITCAVFDGENIAQVHRVTTQECLQRKTFLENLTELHTLSGQDVVISSVRRQIKELIIEEISKETGRRPFVVDVSTDMGITLLYETPETLGVDRIICAAAGFHLYSKGESPLIVIDLGTATTMECISENGEYLGGVIAPGLMSSYEGLLMRAPELPRRELEPGGPLIGRSTTQCILSGVIHGHASLVEGMTEKMARSMGSSPGVLITGGFSALVKPLLPETYVLDQDLILKGLRIICLLSRGNKC